MKNSKQYVLFTLDEQCYALLLASVERAIRVVEITPLPKSPQIIIGVINVQGRIIPVVNTRRRFGLPERDIELNDQLLITRTSRRSVALLVDGVTGVIERTESDIIPSDDVLSSLDYVEGAIKADDRIVLINDIEKFLSLDEKKKIEVALKNT